MHQTFKRYYMLTKPGIIFGNILTALGGFALATKRGVDLTLLLASVVGLGLIIGSGCVLNNFLDRLSDRFMPRTKNRPLAKGTISEKGALLYAFCLVFLGIAILLFFTNLLATLVALVGFVIYVLFYTILKHKTVHATAIGSIAGAVPPVVGYCSVSEVFDLPAFLFFSVVTFWQMPHFFAIALYRIEEYRAASIPVLPIKKGAFATKIQMILYILGFMIACSLLHLFGYLGNLYLIVTMGLSLVWLWFSIQGFKANNDKIWARKMFLFSLIVIMGVCFTIFIEEFFF